MTFVFCVALALITGKAVVEIALAKLNRKHVLANRERLPEAFAGVMEPEAYAKSVEYTIAKNRLSQFETIYDACVLVLALVSGFLPWFFGWFKTQAGSSVWAMAAYLFAVGFLLSLPGLPVSWYGQFRLEQRFGFN